MGQQHTITREELAQFFSCDASSGKIVRTVRVASFNQGSVVGRLNSWGYLHFRHRGIDLQNHRVVWLFSFGMWPSGMLDHINRDKEDNRLVNLRECTARQNAANTVRDPGSRSRFRGVTRHRSMAKFQATCARRYLGVFDSEEDAARAYDACAQQIYGEFARLNFGAAT